MQIRTTGFLTLNNGQEPNRTNTCLSSYSDSKPNYALSNFKRADAKSRYHTKGGIPAFKFRDPDIGDVFFPTAEHYLHFQRLSRDGKRYMLDQGWAEARTSEILRGKTQPGSKWQIDETVLHPALKNPQGKFDAAQWSAKAAIVQMQINATKYQQSQEFRDCIDAAIALGEFFGDDQGAAFIIEDTASLTRAKHPETKWGTGPKGNGENLLGISQTAFANLLTQVPRYKDSIIGRDEAPAIYEPSTEMLNAYAATHHAYSQSGLRKALIHVRKDCDNALNQPDTSDLNYKLVRTFDSIEELQFIKGEVPFSMPEDTQKAAKPAAVPEPSKPIPISKKKQRKQAQAAPVVLSKQNFLNKANPQETVKEQATRIFAALREDLKNDPKKKICILYAANDEQARLLHGHNFQNMDGAIPVIDGSGQAELFNALIKKINAKKLQSRICIAPIATSLTGGKTPKDNKVTKLHIDRDLGALIDMIEAGWTVYGIPRIGRDEYAIGGGNSSWWVEDPSKELGQRTQNAYVQAILKNIERESKKAEPDYSNVLTKTIPLVGEIEAHIRELEKEAGATFFGERRRHKIAVLKVAKGLIDGTHSHTEADLTAIKEANPKWDYKTIGESKVKELVQKAVKQAAVYQVDVAAPVKPKKK